MRCDHCTFENPNGVVFCGKCGSRIGQPCPECNFMNPHGFLFCGQCGFTLEKTSELQRKRPAQENEGASADKQLESGGSRSEYAAVFGGTKAEQDARILAEVARIKEKAMREIHEEHKSDGSPTEQQLHHGKTNEDRIVYVGHRKSEAVSRSEGSCTSAIPPTEDQPYSSESRLTLKPKDLYNKMLSESAKRNLGVDESTRFLSLGGRHHPWRRFFARFVDFTLGYALFCLLAFLLISVSPEQMAWLLHAVFGNLLALLLLLCLLWLLTEAVLLSVTGTTPGKSFFGIEILRSDGHYLSFKSAFKRTLMVCIQAYAFGIPIANLFTLLFAYRRLTRTGSASWDRSVDSIVAHTSWGPARSIICILITAGALLWPFLWFSNHKW